MAHQRGHFVFHAPLGVAIGYKPGFNQLKLHGDFGALLVTMRKLKKSKSTEPLRRAPKRPKSAGTTIDDIAAAARVSIATVSRYFNSPGMLKVKTAKRVRDAVEKRGYVPSMVASGLASNKSHLVAAVVPVVSQSLFNSTVQGLSDALTDQGYNVMLCLSGINDEYLHRQLMSIVGRRPDGIILTGTTVDPASRKLLVRAGISTIETWDLPADPIDLVVGLSHEKVGIAIARHAIATGRRRAFVISANGARAQTRRDSFSRTMVESGAPEPIIATFPGSTTFGQGRTAVAAHLNEGRRPDLIVCSSDMCAQGVIHELQRLGLRVPEDIAVIGFGDFGFAADLTPSLTTIKIDGNRIGQQAVNFLMLRAQGKKIENPVVDIGFSLILRESG